MDENSADADQAGRPPTPPPSPPRGALNWNGLINHIKLNKIDVALWCTRVITMFFTFSYFIPIFGNPYSAYYKALMSNAATSALRLHQRMPNVQLNQEFLRVILLEDSCHYLFYSLIFLYVSPLTFVLVPIAMFAVLNGASYGISLLDALGQNSLWGARMAISIVEFQSMNMLKVAAYTEIILMPVVVMSIFTGKAGILTPFIYYNFLQLRYSSRRNQYTRNAFRDMRVTVEHYIHRPQCPGVIRNYIIKLISIICRLAPPERPHPQGEQHQQ